MATIEYVPIGKGSDRRLIALSPQQAKLVRERQKVLDQWGLNKSRELREAKMLPKSSSNPKASYIPPCYAHEGKPVDNVQAWNESKRERMNNDFETYDASKQSAAMNRMNAAFSSINLSA